MRLGRVAILLSLFVPAATDLPAEEAATLCPACPSELSFALTGAPLWTPEPDSLASFFENEVWAKVGERTCVNCHSPGGDAHESKFLLRDTTADPSNLSHNRAAFERMASQKKDGKSRILVKVAGGLDHGGGVPLKPGSTGYRILEEFVKRLDSGATDKGLDAPLPPFFKGVRMASPSRLWRPRYAKNDFHGTNPCRQRTCLP